METIDYFDHLTANAPLRWHGDQPTSRALRIRYELINPAYFRSGIFSSKLDGLMVFELALLSGCLIDDLCQ